VGTDALAWGVILESNVEMEKNPAEAIVGVSNPQEDPLTRAKYTKAFLSFSRDEPFVREGMCFLDTKAGVPGAGPKTSCF
jgi:hypothetical protein